MAMNEKIWHPNFIEYMQLIAGHPNYSGLPIKVDSNGGLKWIATAKSEVGLKRKEWAEGKAEAMGIPIGPGVYAKVMYAVHPSKIKICQICGQGMSISYIYPNASFAKSIIKEFRIEIGIYDSIYEVWDTIVNHGYTALDFINLINIKFDTKFTLEDGKEKILKECESLCRLGGRAHFGPGAMSNFPDRFDGFHTYNRCHRSLEDRGRSKENLKSYTRDRRAYEYWSDGNIQAANQFMGSQYFKGVSADHVGPISLGFVHDSHYLRPMTGSDNSAKRDRLSEETIDEVVEIYKKTHVYPMSWYSAIIWDYIVDNYKTNPKKVAGDYRDLLKQNMTNFMYILKIILDTGAKGEEFLVKTLLLPKNEYFLHKYAFNDMGVIMSKEARNITQRASGEFDRFTRVAFKSVYEYSEKLNRNTSADLNDDELHIIKELLVSVESGSYTNAQIILKRLIERIQVRLVKS